MKLVDPAQAKFEVHWLPFQLAPDLKESIDKLGHYKSKFGEQRTTQIIAQMAKVGKVEGIAFDYGGKFGNTLNAHRLIEKAASVNLKLQDAMVEGLFRAYFENKQDIADVPTLVAIAEKAGLPKPADFLASDELKKEVLESAAVAAEETNGVPFFIINDKPAFSGAEDVGTLLEAFVSLGGLDPAAIKKK